jgi:hypothetical protein
MVCGPTWSGKTSFIVALLDQRNDLFDVVPKTVYWFYGQETRHQEMLVKNNYVMHDGLPDSFDFCEPNSVIVLDDLMTEAAGNAAVTALYTKSAHHRPYFVITMLQNLFFQSKEMRNRHLNTQYYTIFKMPRDLRQLSTLSQQMYPSKKNYLVEIYNRECTEPHSYLFLDLHQMTSELIRVRKNILPHEKPMLAFVDRKLLAKSRVLKRLQ